MAQNGHKDTYERDKEQILKDGGHFERSPMYHSIVLEDILDLVNVIRTSIYLNPFLEQKLLLVCPKC